MDLRTLSDGSGWCKLHNRVTIGLCHQCSCSVGFVGEKKKVVCVGVSVK